MNKSTLQVATILVATRILELAIACKQALRMGYSEICFRIARGRASRESVRFEF